MSEASGSAPPSVLMGSPLRERRVALPLATILAFIVFFSLIQLISTINHLSQARQNTLGIFFSALLLSSLSALVPLVILRYLDRRERESGWLFLLTFLWGAVIATGLSIPLNGMFLQEISEWLIGMPALSAMLGPRGFLLLGAPVGAPLVEETFKALGIVLLFVLLRNEFDGIRDGFIYGALVGIGFNWLESAVYVAQGFAEFGVAPAGLQLGGRYALFGLSGHALYSGIFGAFLGWSAQTTRRSWHYLAPLVGYLLALTAHAINNGLGLLIVLLESAAGQPPPGEPTPPPPITFWQGWLQKSLLDLLIFLPLFIMMLILLWRSGVWERRWIVEELRDEVGGAVTPEEYARIRQDRLFRTRRVQAGDGRSARALVNAQNELAFRKHRLRLSGGNPEEDGLVLAWREQIEHLRNV